MSQLSSIEFKFSPQDNQRLSVLSGHLDENLRLIERRMGVEINNRANSFNVIGDKESINDVKALLQQLYTDTQNNSEFKTDHVHVAIQHLLADMEQNRGDYQDSGLVIKTKRGLIRPRGMHQQQYVSQIQRNDISFGIGPAGTGKTYLAVACAVDALERQDVRRIVLTRPAVEAGERLGFLPGDLAQKVDPYLRPLYDALYEMLGFEKVDKYMERNIIEVAPLAYMRGRTLNDAFIILDESQNTSPEQMKMFLTRIGFNSRAVITGDITQTDLPKGQKSGLRNTIDVLQNIKSIAFTFFQSADVVRHDVVQKVVEAYERHSDKSS
ncbi:MAG TPA: PhoH family protein [Aeromonadales bacterium]|nr:PhoH family protein [Aeromonadales bacterium]